VRITLGLLFETWHGCYGLRRGKMRRALVVVVVMTMGSLLVAVGPVRAASGAPSTSRRSSVAGRSGQVDFNGDDFDDLAVGVPSEDVGGQVNAGVVNILFGSASGLTGTNQLLTQASPEAGDQFGASVAKGDFNNDTFTDLAVGAPGETLASDAGAGAVNVFYGSSSGLATTSQVLVQANPEAGDRFGAAVEAGNFNDGNAASLAVGAPGENSSAGVVNAFYLRGDALSGTSQVLQQASPEGGDRFGAALVALFYCGLTQDLAVGASGEDVGTTNAAGAVNVFCGGDFQLSNNSQVLLQPHPEAGDQFGAALAAGLFNTMGGRDLAVGAPTEDVGAQPDAGMVTVFSKTPTQTSTKSFVQGPGTGGAAEAGDRFGASLAAGSLDGTILDLAVGAPGEDLGTIVNVGAVNILYGTASGLVGQGQVLVQGSPGVADTAESDDSFGSALAKGFSSNDFNGDGPSDLAIGVPREDVGATVNAGAVNILYGSTTGFPSTTGGQFFTQDSAGMADTAEPDDGLGTALD
jgi:hypothetical protein